MPRGAKAASTLTPGIFDMDLDGIDAAFLYPSVGLFAGAVEDHQLAAAMCRAYNRWLADYCRPYPDRLFGVAMLPMQSVDLAIDEMRYARQQLGMRGGFSPAQPVQGSHAARPLLRAVLDDGRGARFFDRLSRGLKLQHAHRWRRPVRGPCGTPQFLAHHGDLVAAMSVIWGGVCERHPRICLG
jgi:uncharacterized protein